jgi:hypothetical protein
MDLFPSWSEGREAPTLSGPVIEVSSFWGTQQSTCVLPHLKTETDLFPKCVYYLEFRTKDKIHKASDSEFYSCLLHYVLSSTTHFGLTQPSWGAVRFLKSL